VSRVEALTPAEFAALRAREPELRVLDVREPREYAYCHLPDSVLVPLGELVQRIDELDLQLPWVVVCHHGVRSARAAGFLGQRGCAQVYNLSGGLERWASDMDPAFPRY
jgi:rhodanese-related sulfurtransferase